MKNRKLTIALATVAFLGAASLSTGSDMLARIVIPGKAPAPSAGSAVATQNPLPEKPVRQAALHGATVAVVSNPGMVPVMVSSQSGDARVADHGGANMAVAGQPGTARPAAASGSTASGQVGSTPSAPGRSVEGGAMAVPSAAMSRPATAPVAQAGGSSAGVAGARAPVAAPSDASASPGIRKDSGPAEVAKAASPEPIEAPKAASPKPTEVAKAAPPDPLEIAKAALPDPIEIAQAALPQLTDLAPVSAPSAPSQDWNVPSAGAVQDIPTAAAQTVSEPSTLALIGIAALGLMARRRMKLK